MNTQIKKRKSSEARGRAFLSYLEQGCLESSLGRRCSDAVTQMRFHKVLPMASIPKARQQHKAGLGDATCGGERSGFEHAKNRRL
jgi:hypothetical protein